MAPSRPIISKPFLAGDEPTSLREYEGLPQPPSRDGASRRSSASRTSSRGSKTGTRSGSAQSERSTRGRKRYELNEEADRGIVKILASTDVPFDTVAQAVETGGGPRKLWLRRRLEQITGSKSLNVLRLRSDRENAEDRKQRQLRAKELANDLGLDFIDRNQSQMDPQGKFHYQNPSVPPNLESDARRPRHLSTASLTRVYENGNASAPNARRGHTQSWTASASKRHPSEDTTDGLTVYVSKGNRARALSISSITRRLEDMTGNQGLYEHIRRWSVKSHISPLFRSVRWSRGSRATSGRTSFPSESGPYDPNSAIDKTHVIYIPDPDFETFYHTPSQELIASAQLRGAIAVSVLLQARTSLDSDRQAKTRLANSLPSRPEDCKAYVNQADENGVTALHLAVAYGYPHVCVLLMSNEANPRVVTHRRSSVCRFAKPAQELTEGDISLYHRILNSRQWVCAGVPPPLGSQSGSSEKIPPTYRRIRTGDAVPTLSTVDEAIVSEPSPIQPDDVPDDSIPFTSGGLPPLVTDFEFARPGAGGAFPRRASLQQQQTVFEFEDSPGADSLQHCLRDHSPIQDLLTPDSFSPEWSLRFPAHFPTQMPMQQDPASFGSQTQSSGHGSFDGLGIMPNGGSSRPSSTWPESNLLGLDYPMTTPNLGQGSGLLMEDHLVSGAVQNSSQASAGLEHFNNPGAFASGYLDGGQYQLAQNGQQHHRPFETWYLTPPAEQGFPRQQHQQQHQQHQPANNWVGGSDVSRATAHALEEQTLSSFPPVDWHGHTGQGHDQSTYYYHHHDPTSHHYQ